MKKFLLILTLILTVGTASLFADEGLTFRGGVQVSEPLIFKTFLGVNAGVDYHFSNGLGLGAGTKLYWNPTHNEGESYVYPMFFGLLEYRSFYIGGGMSFDFVFDDPRSLYLTTGGAIPIWEAGPGKIGFDFGLEFWVNKNVLHWEDSDGNDNAFEFGILTIPKIYFGVSYFLPL